MKKIIVDTNIIFSCLLHTQGAIGDLMFNSGEVFSFYSNQYMQWEMRKHWDKLKKISGLSDEQLSASYDKLLTRLTFINEVLIPEADWLAAEALVAEIDPDDTDFVALTRFLKGSLWTGDKPLYEGLKARHFHHVYNTQDLMKLRERISEK